MKKVVQLFTVSMSIRMLEGLYAPLRQAGYQMVVICADGPEAQKGVNNGEFEFYPIEMARGFDPIKNVKSWFQVRQALKTLQPDIVHGNTPIGGIIAMTAAYSLGIKNRIFTLHGLRYPAETGLKKTIVKFLEKMTISFSKETIAVSHALKDYAIQEGLDKKGKIRVLHHGSVKGIDTEQSDIIRSHGREFYEEKYHLNHDSFRIGYLGRINEDKGVPELVAAITSLKMEYPGIEAIFCGPEEFVQECNRNAFLDLIDEQKIKYMGFVSDPLEHMSCCDCVVLPTHREGFGLVNIEANSVGIPVITTDVMGCKNSIEDGVTGLFFKMGDINDLYEKIKYLINNPSIAKTMGLQGVERARKLYDRNDVWNALIDCYDQVTGE
jgi:glycosyltransferase involved in cell wall biosynthesis